MRQMIFLNISSRRKQVHFFPGTPYCKSVRNWNVRKNAPKIYITMSHEPVHTFFPFSIGNFNKALVNKNAQKKPASENKTRIELNRASYFSQYRSNWRVIFYALHRRRLSYVKFVPDLLFSISLYDIEKCLYFSQAERR